MVMEGERGVTDIGRKKRDCETEMEGETDVRRTGLG